MKDARWLRALPLLLTAAVLFTAGAYMFFKIADNVASVASMTAGVLLLGAWLVTAIIDWNEGFPQTVVPEETEQTDDGTAPPAA